MLETLGTLDDGLRTLDTVLGPLDGADGIIMVADGWIPADIASMIRLCCLFGDIRPLAVCFVRPESASRLLCEAHRIQTFVAFCNTN